MADGCVQQAIRWDGSLFESALANVADAVVVTDGTLDWPGPRIVYVNPAFCRMTGYAESELIGRTPRLLQGPGTESRVLSDLRASLGAGHSFVGVTTNYRPDGSAYGVEWSITPARDASDGALYFVSIQRPVDECGARREYLEALQAVGVSGVLVIDAQGCIESVDPGLARLFGYTVPELLGQPVEHLVPRGLRERHEQMLIACREQSGPECPGIERDMAAWHKGGYHVSVAVGLTTVSVAGRDRTLATLRDKGERDYSPAEMRYFAETDWLTGLFNREGFLDQLGHHLASRETGDTATTLILVNLDDFKALNDTLGSNCGDALLQATARQLRELVGDDHILARLGGDEFAILAQWSDGASETALDRGRDLARAVLYRFNQAYAGGEGGTRVEARTCSIGLTLLQADNDSVEEAVKRADLALYEAKTAGPGSLRVFDPALQERANARVLVEREMPAGIADGAFVPFFQPLVRADGCWLGAEALARWLHPQRGVVGPCEFIPAAEKTGLINRLGMAILRQACEQLAAWAAEPGGGDLGMSVNISARQFHDPDFVDRVFRVLDRTGVEPERLRLELTESVFVHDVDWVVARMEQLRVRGITFALDDFGTGYSSLSHLARLPIDVLKIDQGFVREVTDNAGNAAIVRTVIALARSLDMQVLAEGVETPEERAFLTDAGCDAFQGYLFGAPLPASDWLKRFHGSVGMAG